MLRNENFLTLSDGWDLTINYCDQPNVLEESQKMASQFGADREDTDEISAANRRFEVSTDPDPDMDRFSDFATALEALTLFNGAVAFDPEISEFM